MVSIVLGLDLVYVSMFLFIWINVVCAMRFCFFELHCGFWGLAGLCSDVCVGCLRPCCV